MMKYLRDFLQLFVLGIVVSLGLNWLLGKPYVLDAHNVIMSLTISLIVLWVAFETKRRAQ